MWKAFGFLGILYDDLVCLVPGLKFKVKFLAVDDLDLDLEPSSSKRPGTSFLQIPIFGWLYLVRGPIKILAPQGGVWVGDTCPDGSVSRKQLTAVAAMRWSTTFVCTFSLTKIKVCICLEFSVCKLLQASS